FSLRNTAVPKSGNLHLDPRFLRATPVNLPEVSERDLVAHFTRLAERNYSVDLGAYPLGSCTMKYNPKFADVIATLEGLSSVHPATPVEAVQGWLELLVELEEMICEITGMTAATLQPPAGAAGELTGLLIMRAYHRSNGRSPSVVLIPDSSHGTNAASVTLAGYKAVTIPSGRDGLVDLHQFKEHINEDVAGVMLTNPNTVGLFESDIAEILALVRSVDGISYYDGANLNAIVGITRPGDMGFDVVHSNLHKTFATPHGGGGPGAGPVAVSARLVEFLPGPRPRRNEAGNLEWASPLHSIGRVHGGYGNSLVLARALAFMKYLGGEGLVRMSELAVLNATWLRAQIEHAYPVAFPTESMHEFVASAQSIKRETGVRALDIAKALLEYGFHAPTVYFPLIVEEALMIEPTETESPQTLRALADALVDIAERAHSETGAAEIHNAPRTTPVRRLDEARAARRPVLTYDARG
ncbi:MAG: aminomethyl-transferring glycine dehydrogenase subunit GcvPB, partial [Acidimicrobiales bacterium]